MVELRSEHVKDGAVACRAAGLEKNAWQRWLRG